ncbi:MAG: hypothetical protein WAT38_03850 [Nitrospira sp.]|jgi:hypothetical protein|nr:hypothetical protein [Nitrospira sp.]OYT21683.1 MAG: hypothetical protein CCU27_17460 [Nitrospira sp. UW-LDO-02]SLM42336.1 conserved exported hypothetical protein [Nitrospira sp. ND1]MBK7485786.1 hypothetical protein [Nitrospira sp.]MBK8378851.1 hypothetical protein [Nitrospira sp.]
MTMPVSRHIIGISLGVVLFAGNGLAAEPADVEKFVNARIEIGEMMTNYFKGGESYGSGQRPSPEKMKEMGDDINAKLTTLLSKHGLTLEDYRARSKDVFADDAAVKGYLAQHPDLKTRYEALPLNRMSGGGGGSTGRGY